MIIELSREHCWSLRQHDRCPALVAYLNKITYSRQLKSLIELSEAFSDDLKIYVTRDTSLKVISSGSAIQGTPTYILVINGAEQDRLLGESDALRLKHFVGPHIEQATGRSTRFDTTDPGIARGRAGES